MARILLIIITTFIILSCKKGDFAPIPNSVVGKWRLVLFEKPTNGSNVWESPSDSMFIFFSATGEVVNSAGERRFCGPSQLVINGRPYKIKMVSRLDNTPFLGLCAECPSWDLQISGEELLLNNCSPSYRKKFVKVR